MLVQKLIKTINIDLSLEIENSNKVKLLHKQREDRIKKGNLCYMTAKEKRMFREYMIEYRNIPKEKDADEFVLDNMEKCWYLLNN